MWELDYNKSWGLKNWCFWTVVLEKALESPLDCKIQPVHPKRDQSWVFIGRTDAEAETPILWAPDMKNQLIWKDPDPGKDWGQEKKGTTEDEMALLTQWTWVWVNARSCWWTGRPGMLRFMGLQSWTRLNWTEWVNGITSIFTFWSLLLKIFLNLFIWLYFVFVAALRIQFHDQGSNLGPLHWAWGVLATGPPGKCHSLLTHSILTLSLLLPNDLRL